MLLDTLVSSLPERLLLDKEVIETSDGVISAADRMKNKGLLMSHGSFDHPQDSRIFSK